MRKAEEILAWLEPIFICEADIAKLDEAAGLAQAAAASDVVEKINAACMLGFSGRAALEAARGAVIVKRGEAAPKLTGIQLLDERYEDERRVLKKGSDVVASLGVNFECFMASELGTDSERESLARLGCAAALLLESWEPREADLEEPTDAHD